MCVCVPCACVENIAAGSVRSGSLPENLRVPPLAALTGIGFMLSASECQLGLSHDNAL